MKTVGSTQTWHEEIGLFQNFVLTKQGSLIGALRLTGQDPDGLCESDYHHITLFLRNLLQSLPEHLVVTQYYHQHLAPPLTHRARPLSHSEHLSQQRLVFLNNHDLTQSCITIYCELLPTTPLPSALRLLSAALKSPFDPTAREIVYTALRGEEHLIFHQQSLDNLAIELNTILTDIAARLTVLRPVERLTPLALWQHMHTLANLTPSHSQAIPDMDWDSYLSNGDRSEVEHKHMQMLKFHGTTPLYARIAAVTRFGHDKVHAGMWSQGLEAPTRQGFQALIVVRFMPFSRLQRSLFFQEKKNVLARRRLQVDHLLNSHSSDDHRTPHLQQDLLDLQQASHLEDRWGMAHAFVVLYASTPDLLATHSRTLSKSLYESGFQFCWESLDLANAWRTCLPAGWRQSMRDIPFTTTQFAAASLLYQPHQGQPHVADLQEEAQYIFLSDNNSPFHYSPFVGGRAMVFGVGPIRSGKSFTKNTLACHFLKYGGFFRALDIDPGTEPLVSAFSEQAGLFKISGAHGGFNPFVSARNEQDLAFIQHVRSQVMTMLAANDTVTLRLLDADEQHELDQAILATLKLPPELQNLSAMAHHCSLSLQQKLSRWLKGGFYGALFDQESDALGTHHKPLAVFNLNALKDDEVALKLVMREIFFRITRLFEDESYRHIPKFLDIDEAHLLLQHEAIANQITQYVRTWGKWQAGLSLWSQSPQEFLDLPSWPALRSAASTLFFMADPCLDINLYQTTFQLTLGECRAIQKLKPKQEAYLIQRELGVSKKIILTVEPEQYVLATSTPQEVALRNQNLQSYGFERGLAATIQDLGLSRS